MDQTFSEQSPSLSLSYVLPQQAQKHVTVNETFRRLDVLVQSRVISRSIAVEPATPAEGDSYIITDGASGSAWQSFAAGSLVVFQDGAWAEIIPQVGWRVFVLDEDILIAYGQNGWAQISSGSGDGPQDTSAQFGINTDADNTNRLAVKSDAILFSHDDVTPGSGDIRHVFNKAESGRTGSMLFQTSFSGRIELGLLGNDDFTIQVSADGQSFLPAFIVDHVSGQTLCRSLQVGVGTGVASIRFSTNIDNNPYWAIGQGSDESFFIQRLSGGFGTGGKVLIYDDTGSLGLWGPPSTKGRISTRSNVNVEGVDNILYLEQTAASAASGVAQFHNRQNNSTPILRCTTDTRTVLHVPANGSILVDAPFRLMSVTVAGLPTPSFAGDGAMVYVIDAAGGSVPAFSDGANWRRVTDRSIVS